MHAIKRLKNKTITLLLSVIIAVSLLFGAIAAVAAPSRAETVDDIVEFVPTSLNVSNPDFDQSSGSYPAPPTSWSGETLDNGNGNLIKGVVDLTPSVYSSGDNGNKNFELDQYDEYSSETSIPKTIFGENTKYGGNEQALMLNTAKGAAVAYAYKSSDMILNANSFYRFSVWVKTGNFVPQTGATIKLSGLGQNFAFNNINTVKNLYIDGKQDLNADNDYGWVQYTMYVRTSASLSHTVNLSLGIGDAVTGGDEDPDYTVRPASGYAFFDTVTAEQISAYDFASETQHFTQVEGRDNVYTFGDGTALAINLNETKSLTTIDGKEIGTFSQNTDLWSTDISYNEFEEDKEFIAPAHISVYNSQSRIKDLESNDYGLTQNPWAPFGRAEYDILDGSPFFEGKNNAGIMMISTYDGSDFQYGTNGIASPFINIERFKYYRLSVWVKGDSIVDGNGITVILRGKLANDNAANPTLIGEFNNLEGDSEDTAHYGWKEQVFYIQGSVLFDYQISMELWLGTPYSLSSGIAMFDNVTFIELKYSDYTDMSAADEGNVYSVDQLENDTNITNGNFIDVGDYEEFKYPLPVAEWSYLTPDSVNSQGHYSTKEVNTDNAVYGIVPADVTLPGVDKINDNNLYNILLLSSTTQTAFCYQSPAITLSTDTANKLTVDLAVTRINGYGASLVLKTTDGAVLATIENITDTNRQFRTFTFYLAAPLSDQSVYVEIWLGMTDMYDNTRRLSSGNVYVKQVALNTWTAAEDSTVADEYDQILEQYKFDVSHSSSLSSLDYSVYSFTAPSFDYYDVYSYAQDEGYGALWQWSRTSETGNVKGGVFNTNFMKDLTVYSGFSPKDLSGTMLYIFNTEKNRTKYTYDNSIALVANMYYRIDVAVKVKVTDEVRTDDTSIGANIKLVGTSAQFQNIKDTTTLIDVNNESSRDRETFKTYTFYISTGDDGGNIGMEITFGGDTIDSYIQGSLIIGGITMTKIDNLDYEAAEKLKDDNVIAVKLSETNDSDTDNNTEAPSSSSIQWWVIPTIIFSAALLAAVILIIVLRIREHIKRKKKVTYTTEYDRNDVMDEIERLKAQDSVKSPEEDVPTEKEPEADNGEQAPADDTPTESVDNEQPEVSEPAEQPKKEEKPSTSDTDLDD